MRDSIPDDPDVRKGYSIVAVGLLTELTEARYERIPMRELAIHSDNR